MATPAEQSLDINDQSTQPVEDIPDDRSSLCESDLELEMAWGEGPIAPLRAASTATTSTSDANKQLLEGGSPVPQSRAKTPQKRGNASPLIKSKRLVNLHPIRSAPYLSNPNQLPVGQRAQQRWMNDHHFGDRPVTATLEELLEHMTLKVEWRSNFEELAQPENQELQAAFRKSRIHIPAQSNGPRFRRRDNWDEAEELFSHIDRRARTLLLRSFKTFVPFLEAVEAVVVHYINWKEVPSSVDLSEHLTRLLVKSILLSKEKEPRLLLPLVDSAFHRLLVHSVCQFYGVRSKTEPSVQLKTKIMVLRFNFKKCQLRENAKQSLCEFIRETRVRENASQEAADHIDKMSECSDGFCLMEFPDP